MLLWTIFSHGAGEFQPVAIKRGGGVACVNLKIMCKSENHVYSKSAPLEILLI